MTAFKAPGEPDYTDEDIEELKNKIYKLEITLRHLIAWMSVSSVSPINMDESSKLLEMLKTK